MDDETGPVPEILFYKKIWVKNIKVICPSA
jgi:hypothetical protein